LARRGRDFRMRSRWMLLFAGVRNGVRWLRARASRRESVEIVHTHAHPVSDRHEHDSLATSGPSATTITMISHRHAHRHVLTMPDDPFTNYGPRTAFGIGMIHGIGAETPTQVLIFLAAAGTGGRGTGVLLLVCFLVGLLSSNSLIALAGSFGFLG